jgi:membrane fusion protein (multidrug efflux system)
MAPTASAGQPEKLRRTSRKVLAGIALLLAAIALASGYLWWRTSSFRETDNAYVNGHVHPVSSRVAGVVTRVLIVDNQQVKAGELLAELDTAEHRLKIDQIRAQIAAIQQQIVQAESQIEQARAEEGVARALTAKAAVEQQYARQEAVRYRELYASKVVAKSQVDTTEAVLAGAVATTTAGQHSATAARTRIDVAIAGRKTLATQQTVLEAQLRDAELQLTFNRIVAPVAGRIGKRVLEVGARVQPGQQLLAVVQDEVWVTANFKETQLPGLRVGQRVTLRADALPGLLIHGRIDSIAPASGAQFALLPPDNATGNFTRVVQRVPVKIVLDKEEVAALAGILLPGMSTVAEVDLRGTRPKLLGRL